MKKIIYLLFVLFYAVCGKSQSLITPFEKSGGKQTATYFETIRYYHQLAERFQNIRIIKFDTTDAGYPLHLVMFATEKGFDPAKLLKKIK